MSKTPAKRAPRKKTASSSSDPLIFEDNSLLPALFGNQDCHLARIEQKFNVSATSRGNLLSLTGDPKAVDASKAVLMALYEKLEKGGDVGPAQVDAAIRMSNYTHVNAPSKSYPGKPARLVDSDVQIKTLKKTITPYSHVQAEYIKALYENDLVFALGPAGTGKTYIAVAMAVLMFINKKVERIILSRPAVEAGERLGFLPGDLKEKIDPYLRPLYDALYDMIPGDRVLQHLENGEIEVAPLAFMRGRTLSNAFVILDEAQNTTPTQMKMFLTRLGENSRMVVTGDLSQTDLPKDISSGLRDAVRKVEKIPGIGCIRFGDSDVVRHDLAAKIVQAYDEWDRKKKSASPDTL